MNPGPLEWQQSQWQQLCRLEEARRLPHGLLFSGPGEIGKRQFTLAFAQQLLCQAPGEQGPCGDCKSCRLFQASTHPDFLLIEPEAEGKAVKVDQVRRLGEFATRTAALGNRRVIVVAPAEAMNLNAANAFLKTLEEPGEGVVLLLVSHQPGMILPTIRSRCRILAFPLPDKGEVLAWLHRQVADSADADQAMTLSGGRPFRARRLLETDLREQLALFRETLAALEQRKLPPLEAARVLQGMPAEDALEWFQYQVYVRIRAVAGSGNRAEKILFQFLDRLATVRQRLLSTANPNPQLAWEEVLMDWKSVVDLAE